MSRYTRQFLTLLFQALIFWVLAFCFLVTIRYLGIYEERGVSILPKFEIAFFDLLYLSALAGVPLGIFYACIEFFFERFVSKRIVLGLVILTKTIIYLIFLIILLTFVMEYTGYIFDIPMDNDLGWWRTDKTFWVLVLYFGIASIVFSFIKIANEKFGPGIFIKMLLGKYKNPQEEKRIFMFLDLKSSTTIAEQLGHYKYSQFIQDCFYDLNAVVRQFDAEIYQYVGDEAVLSWTYTSGIKKANCVNLYFSFKDRLHRKSEYYQQKYATIPEFKAGIHGGTLMVAEVGIIKKELAYHGDVINTAARIQSKCNTLNVSILISESLTQKMKLNSYEIVEVGEVLLKGKQEKVAICTINKK